MKAHSKEPLKFTMYEKGHNNYVFKLANARLQDNNRIMVFSGLLQCSILVCKD